MNTGTELTLKEIRQKLEYARGAERFAKNAWVIFSAIAAGVAIFFLCMTFFPAFERPFMPWRLAALVIAVGAMLTALDWHNRIIPNRRRDIDVWMRVERRKRREMVSHYFRTLNRHC